MDASSTLAAAFPAWAAGLFASGLTPRVRGADDGVLVWAIADEQTTATVTDQFKANAAEYHQRFGDSAHFEALFRQALEATGVSIPARPLILDVGSGSGVNSIVPCRRIFPDARTVATDLSVELLTMLAGYLQGDPAADVVCVRMDAMGSHVAPGAFDLVTGTAILHHLDNPWQGIAAAGRALRSGGHAMFFEPFNGWGVIRLAFERILAEERLHRPRLDRAVKRSLEQMVEALAERTDLQQGSPKLAVMDDKWLFSRTWVEKFALDAGFSRAQFVPHLDHENLYRDVARVHLRLSTGRTDLDFPPWAVAILDSFDAAFTYWAKRELMLEGTIVLTKA